MKYTIICTICGSLIIILLIIGVLILHNEGFSAVATWKTVGKVVVHQEEAVPRAKIAEVIVKDDRIYLFYDSCGLVNVYTTDGIFQYGLQVGTLANGRGDIAFAGEKLLIKARGNVIYVFDSEKLETFVEFQYTESKKGTEQAHLYDELESYFSAPKPCSYQGKFYTISESGAELLVRDTESSANKPVDFLPRRNTWAYFVFLGVCILVAVLYQSKNHFVKK